MFTKEFLMAMPCGVFGPVDRISRGDGSTTFYSRTSQEKRRGPLDQHGTKPSSNIKWKVVGNNVSVTKFGLTKGVDDKKFTLSVEEFRKRYNI